MMLWVRQLVPSVVASAVCLLAALSGCAAVAPSTPTPAAVRDIAWQSALEFSSPYPTSPFTWVETTLGRWDRLSRQRQPGAGTMIFVVELDGTFHQAGAPHVTGQFHYVVVVIPVVEDVNTAQLGEQQLFGRLRTPLSSLGLVHTDKLPKAPAARAGAVPQVVGLDLPAASQLLRQDGYTVIATAISSSSLPILTVTSESPSAGKLRRGGSVHRAYTPQPPLQ